MFKSINYLVIKLFSINSINFVFQNIYSFIISYRSECPPNDSIKPSVCTKNSTQKYYDELNCGGNEAFDLANVFTLMQKYSGKN